MAEAFIGLIVLVKLKQQSHNPLQGFVIGVQDQRLFLRDVVFPNSRQSVKSLYVNASDIADIAVLSPPTAPTTLDSHQQDQFQLITTPTENSNVKPPSSLRPSQLPPSSQQKSFLDPAILSYGRTASESTVTRESASRNIEQLSADPISYPTGQPPLDSTEPPATLTKTAELPAPLKGVVAAKENINPALLPGKGLALETPVEVDEVEDIEEGLHSTQSAAKKRRNRRRGRGGRGTYASNNGEQEDPAAEVNRSSMADPATPAKGWRKTPILEAPAEQHDAPRAINGTTSQNAASVTKRTTRRQREMDKILLNGWATEDATDVQEMGDFDFEANLSKFDKRAVFAQLRDEDTTADEDRLISYNRAPKVPGTFGGTKLHPMENVLSQQRKNSQDVSSEDDFELDGLHDVRQVPRNQSRTSLNRAATRRGSSLKAQHNDHLAALSHSSRSQKGVHPKFLDLSTSSPKSLRAESPNLASASASAPRKPCLRYVESNHICHTINPTLLKEVEQLALQELKYTEDMLAENAARGVAAVVLAALNPGGHRIERSNHNSQPVVVFLLGNNRVGARALAAARHLQERGIRVIACATNAVFLASSPLALQWQRFGETLRGWAETAAYLKTLDAPPELIVDALLGAEQTFAELEPAERHAALEMAGWANKSRASVVAVDVPSGVNATTGEVQVREGEPAEVRAKVVACCGAPCTGLLKAMELRGQQEDWKIFVLDIGINAAARLYIKKRQGRRGGRLCNFGTDWMVKLRYDAATA